MRTLARRLPLRWGMPGEIQGGMDPVLRSVDLPPPRRILRPHPHSTGLAPARRRHERLGRHRLDHVKATPSHQTEAGSPPGRARQNPRGIGSPIPSATLVACGVLNLMRRRGEPPDLLFGQSV